MKCKHCDSENVIKSGIGYAGKKKQRWLCKSCGRHFYQTLKKGSKLNMAKGCGGD